MLGLTAPKFLTAQEKAQVESAIREAEKRTSAEIVCAVATGSGRYDRAESIIGLIGALIGLGIPFAVNFPGHSGDPAHWSEAAAPSLALLAVSVVLGFVAGNFLATYVPVLRRFLVSAREMEEETIRSASHVFALRRLSNSMARGGVLIYLSLFEHRLVILTDHGASIVLEPADIERLRDIALEHLKKGERCPSLLATIQAAAEKLAAGLPADPQANENELPDELLVYHPRP